MSVCLRPSDVIDCMRERKCVHIVCQLSRAKSRTEGLGVSLREASECEVKKPKSELYSF